MGRSCAASRPPGQRAGTAGTAPHGRGNGAPLPELDGSRSQRRHVGFWGAVWSSRPARPQRTSQGAPHAEGCARRRAASCDLALARPFDMRSLPRCRKSREWARPRDSDGRLALRPLEAAGRVAPS